MAHAFLALLLLLLVPSCFKQSEKKLSSIDTSCNAEIALESFFDSISDRDNYSESEPVLVTKLEALAEYEARLIDVPNHLSAQLIKGSVVDDNQGNQYIQLHYQLQTEPYEIRQFYTKEMERLGWCQYAVMLGTESLLVFEKPERICSIVLRPLISSTKKNSVSHTTVLVTVGAKMSA
jgi:hypothetical protein